MSDKLTLEVGKTYLTRVNNKVRIVSAFKEDNEFYRLGYRFVGGPCGQYYTENGLTYLDGETAPGDLVKELDMKDSGVILPDPNDPKYETARKRMVAILRKIGLEDPRNGYSKMAQDLEQGNLMHVPTWIALGMLAQNEP